MPEEIEEILESFTTCEESILGIIRELRINFRKLPEEYKEVNKLLFDEAIHDLQSAQANIESIIRQIGRAEAKEIRHKKELETLFEEEETTFEEELPPDISKWYHPIESEESSVSQEPRRYGQPRTEEERLKRHFERYGTIELPPRGTGLRKSSVSQIPTCPECGKPMKEIIKGLWQCPDHPFQTVTVD